MKRLVRKTYRLKNFFRNDIWELNLEELSRARARYVKYAKVALITIKTFSSEKIGFQAVALSFFSTMSVVPFVAITFAITGGFGLGETLDFVDRQLSCQLHLTACFLDFSFLISKMGKIHVLTQFPFLRYLIHTT